MSDMTAKKHQRPLWYNLSPLNLPLPGLVSIFHRISGLLLFLAIPFLPGLVATYGGFLVNTEGQVLDWDEQVIPGLYAAGLSMNGSTTGGAENPAGAYVGFQATALIFGLIAAECAAQRIAGGAARR